MKLSQLASKPQLIKITLDEESIIKEFGEAIEFWTWDRQPLDVFMKLAKAENQDVSNLIDIVRTMILDEEGQEIIKGENVLPSGVMVRAIAAITEKLGK